MWFKNLQVFRLTAPWTATATELAEQLARVPFSPVASNEIQSIGWAPPRGDDQLVYSVNKQFLLQLAVEKKLLPASVINQVTKARALEIEEEQGFAPGRKAMHDLKERITEELLPRAFAVKRATSVWIDPVNRWLVIDSSSPSRADEVIKYLLKCADKLPLEGLRTKNSPQSAMTGWLVSNEAPAGFTIDQDTELRASTEDRATVRYTHYTADIEDIQKHASAGKQCTKLALTWKDKVSFVLADTLTIKRVKPLDVLDESKSKGDNETERFDGDFVLMTAELSDMLGDIVHALGGEHETTQG